MAWQKYSETNSLRMDISKEDLPAWAVPQKGVSYYMLDASENQKPAKFKAMDKVVSDALKKAQK